MKKKNRLVSFLLSASFLLSTPLYASNGLSIKGSNNTKQYSGGQFYLKSANGVNKIDLNGSVVSNGNKDVTINTGNKATIKEMSVNLRPTPNYSAETILTIPVNAVVYVLEEVDSTWVKVSYNGKTGYIVKKYVSYDDISANPVPDNSLAIGTVTDMAINLRTTADYSADTLITIPVGAKVYVLEETSVNWIKVSYQNYTGYVVKKYVDYTIEKPVITGKVNATSLNVRASADLNGDVIGSLVNGDSVTVVSKKGDWYRILFKSGYGFVAASYITINGNIMPPVENETTVRKIVLDPGHGGTDPGAIGPSGLKEKDVVLNVSLKVRDILQSKGFEVVMTRSTDIFPSLKERCDIANKADADIFVSIHANSAATPSANGTETFSLQTTGKGGLLSSKIQTNMVKSLKLFDRGAKTANFYVLRYTNMPAALVEIAFISNSNEEKLLGSADFQKKSAESIAQGILEYANEVSFID